MVYTILMESGRYQDGSDFTQTNLYKKCLAAGVIPDPSSGGSRASDAALSIADSISPASELADFQDDASLDTADLLSWSFSVSNMWCPACAWIVEDALIKSVGVVKATCNFSSDRGSVLYDPVKTSPDQIQQIIQKLGYPAASFDQIPKRSVADFVRLFITALFTMNVMMLSWAIYSGFFMMLTPDAIRLLSWPVLIMATIVLLYGGYPIYHRALSGIRIGAPGMETLITTGSFSAYLFSVISMVQGSIHLYFDASSMLILLVLIGKKLEQTAKNRINLGLADFFSLAPEKVKICTDQFPNGRYVTVKQLKKDDIMKVEQGEILAADGIVINGEATIDEASITGEVKPVNVTVNDLVKSGTKVISGQIRVKAMQIGESSVLGKMLTIMKESLSGKTRQSERFERLLRIFVPGVIGLSALTFVFTLVSGSPVSEALNRGLSVMVISCPCALGIAIPLALVAGVSIAGKNGILVRDFEAFERSEALDSIVFDKTGTLTSGKMKILDIHTFASYTEIEVLKIACGMERDSVHFIADTLRSHCLQSKLEPVHIQNVQAESNGLRGWVDGQELLLGSREFLAIDEIPSVENMPVGTADALVVTEVFLSIDGDLAAILQLGDSVRDRVKPLMTNLGKMDYALCLVSGDGLKPTRTVASIVGIDTRASHGALLPHEKAALVKNLKMNGHKVAMVGDGINDAPAMAESDLAVAVHSGLNPGEGVAAITLMQEDPIQLLDFLNLAKRVNRTVRQNLLFALVYNLIGIPIAAAGLLNPIIAVTAMLCSSLSVTFNTLLLVKRETAISPGD